MRSTLPANVRITHVSLFDGSLQGIALTDAPAFSFQGHPEASPGPHDVDVSVRPLHRRLMERSEGEQLTCRDAPTSRAS